MPTITVSDDTYERITRRAAVLGTTVEALVVPVLEQLGHAAAINGHAVETPRQLSSNEWKTNFDAWMADVEARAPLYPPGFECDVSREAMYEGCGE